MQFFCGIEPSVRWEPYPLSCRVGWAYRCRVPSRETHNISGSRANNVASDPSAIKFKQDAFSLWSTVRDATKKERVFLSPRLSNRPHAHSVAGVVCRQTSVRKLLPANPKPGHPRRDQVSDRNLIACQPGRIRQDLEFCFKNAKKYNMEDSPIWKDAKRFHVWWRHKSVIYVTRLTYLRNLSTRDMPGWRETDRWRDGLEMVRRMGMQGREMRKRKRHKISLGCSSRVCRSWSTRPTAGALYLTFLPVNMLTSILQRVGYLWGFMELSVSRTP